MKKEIEIVTLIYKSLDYLDLIYNELKKIESDTYDVYIRIVANDATTDIINKLKTLDIPHNIYNDKNPNDYYLNRVYRCWNFCAITSKYENICFVNSDMVFSKNWLDNLLKHHNGINIPTSRLVESGKMVSGTHGISYNIGRHPNQINYNLWENFVNNNSIDKIEEKGLFMPCIFNTKFFIESGMFPEGNIYKDGIGTLHPDGVIQSGDDWFFRKLETIYGMNHITVFDSLVYHIQEGEKDS